MLSNALFSSGTAAVPPAADPLAGDGTAGDLRGVARRRSCGLIGSNVAPALVRRSSTAYGTIGATFGLLVWLLFVGGAVIVAAGIYERYRWEHRPELIEVAPGASATD